MALLSWLLPTGRVAFHHAPKTALLPCKSSYAGDSKYISLIDLCKAATPPTCQLNPLLFNGHLQTAWTVVKNDDIPVFYKRWRFEAIDPNYSGSFEVDFVVDPYDVAVVSSLEENKGLPPRTTFYTEREFADLPSDDKKPMLVILHGLSGGSHELYLRHVVSPLLEMGWAACVVNFRGCAQSKVTSSILYNARATWDLRQLVKWLSQKFPNRPLFGIGFSLGANILTNYLGEESEACCLKAAVICSNPWNLETGSLALQRTWIGSEIYSKTMGSNMKRLFERHISSIEKHPRVNVEQVRSSRYLHEFDRALQAPVWGYPTESAYYRDASSIDSLFAIKIPFFAINAEDDPISVKEALPYLEIEQTPYGVMCTTTWGGHLSWFESDGSRWFTKPVTGFLNKMATEIDLDLPVRVESGLSSQQVPVTLAPKVDGPIPNFQPMRRKCKMPLAHKEGE
ncbi:hypothetical protein LOZ53_003278 [Ophidiomyces ophidiicola]|nr:hypothetical protein LOZ61_004571 [Ophidiomyces ophidiicola]KAI1922030.1 hypothetical protein LOZ60_005900 [Ophidiomyces ophidiicola]KAI1981254.1 hypothetical protein LOZ55_000750 [Ophidiomyces ophidiicola]KAI1990280.1 hypothetical protein LOZ53_003278 [Ophidiomyces ophidiicola]KAI1990921.1 hypothetical protein LOZ54_002313 [Ophidiomyces ophidiicola]